MRSRTRPRLLALLIGTSLSLWIAWLTWDRWARPHVTDNRTEIERLLARRSVGKGTTIDPAEARRMRPRAPELYIPMEDAVVLLPANARTQVYDPVSYFVHQPDLTIETPWPEHADGRWVFHTNHLGLRENEEVREHVDLRILVTGDSHIEGYCNDAESYPNLLESGLSALRPGRVVDVLNAADGGYSFHNYLGVLEKFDHLGAALFIVNVYAGNDFLEVLAPDRYFAKEAAPILAPEQRKRRKAAADVRFAAWVQGVASICWFHDHPEEVDRALRDATEYVRRIHLVCDADKMRLLVVCIPSAVEIEGSRQKELIQPALDAAGLDAHDLDLHAKIGDRFLDEVRALGIPTFDARPALRAAEAKMFWAYDLHLSVAGHQTIARAIEPVVTGLLGH